MGGGPRGDLYIHITVEPDEIFLRDGTHVICEVPLSFTQAALGAEIRVPTLKGEANLKIPRGKRNPARYSACGGKAFPTYAATAKAMNW